MPPVAETTGWTGLSQRLHVHVSTTGETIGKGPDGPLGRYAVLGTEGNGPGHPRFDVELDVSVWNEFSDDEAVGSEL